MKHFWLLGLIICVLSENSRAQMSPIPPMSQQIWERALEPRTQIEKDKIIFFNTIFPDPIRVNQLNLTPQANEIALLQQNYFKRLILLCAFKPIMYTALSSDLKQIQPWRLPLASAFGHGQRICLLIMPGEQNGSLIPHDSEKVFNFLTTGRSQTAAPFVFNRMATHGMDFNQNTQQIYEEKLGVLGTGSNIYYSAKGYNRGINLPIGGIGNPSPAQNAVIGPMGTQLRLNTVTRRWQPIPSLQQGSQYIYIRQFLPTRSGWLFGLEESAPGTSSPIGGSHSALSGFRNTENDPSVTNGQKMPLLFAGLGQQPPAKYGGLWVFLYSDEIKTFAEICNKVLSFPEEKQKEIFMSLLTTPPLEGRKMLESLIGSSGGLKLMPLRPPIPFYPQEIQQLVGNTLKGRISNFFRRN